MSAESKRVFCQPWHHFCNDMRVEKSVNGFPVRVGKCEKCGLKFARYVNPFDDVYDANASAFALQHKEIAAELHGRN